MGQQEDLLTQLAVHLEAAARVARELAATHEPQLARLVAEAAPELTAGQWVELARELHPALGERQEQVLGEVARAHPDGTGTGPIWRAIDYEQTNTYLTLDALGRQGLVRKDESQRPNRYYLGERLLARARSRS